MKNLTLAAAGKFRSSPDELFFSHSLAAAPPETCLHIIRMAAGVVFLIYTKSGMCNSVLDKAKEFPLTLPPAMD